ncbi:DCC1-like thiol-disulfide oxidoreductase family protein, partial [Bacillus sp. B-TM1]
MIVFYDSWCPMCTAVAERTKKLDKKGKMKFVSFRDEDVVEKYELSQELQSKMEQISSYPFYLIFSYVLQPPYTSDTN